MCDVVCYSQARRQYISHVFKVVLAVVRRLGKFKAGEIVGLSWEAIRGTSSDPANWTHFATDVRYFYVGSLYYGKLEKYTDTQLHD